MTRLQQLRVDALMTPEDLGDATGVSPRTIRRRLEDGRGARIETLRKLARHFEVPASELLAPARPPTNDDRAAA
jgi:transcriptional regulator with XRE-family HTH domain